MAESIYFLKPAWCGTHPAAFGWNRTFSPLASHRLQGGGLSLGVRRFWVSWGAYPRCCDSGGSAVPNACASSSAARGARRLCLCSDTSCFIRCPCMSGGRAGFISTTSACLPRSTWIARARSTSIAMSPVMVISSQDGRAVCQGRKDPFPFSEPRLSSSNECGIDVDPAPRPTNREGASH